MGTHDSDWLAGIDDEANQLSESRRRDDEKAARFIRQYGDAIADHLRDIQRMLEQRGISLELRVNHEGIQHEGYSLGRNTYDGWEDHVHVYITRWGADSPRQVRVYVKRFSSSPIETIQLDAFDIPTLQRALRDMLVGYLKDQVR